jgi:hypothetical protein
VPNWRVETVSAFAFGAGFGAGVAAFAIGVPFGESQRRWDSTVFPALRDGFLVDKMRRRHDFGAWG